MNVDFKELLTILYEYFVKVFAYFYPELAEELGDKYAPAE